MALITAKGIKKYYGDRLIFAFDELEIQATDRLGIVGVNGSGKTTLIEILAGRIKPDQGFVKHTGSFAYIPQLAREDSPASAAVSPEMMSRLFIGGVQEEHASGGEEMRLKIAQAFSEKAALLFADEPTSNLDLESIGILRGMLQSWPGALVMVSHDQDLLNECCNRILEIEGGKVTLFPGNYREFKQEKERQRAFQQYEFEAYRKEKARLEVAVINAANRAASVKKAPKRMGLSEARLHRREATEAAEQISKQANAIKTRLEKLAVKEAPPEEPDVKMAFAGLPKPVSKTLLHLSGVTLAFGKRVLLEGAEVCIPTGSRTAIIGPNGCGKTTLLRWIKENSARTRDYPKNDISNDFYQPSTGEVKVAPGVGFSWFEQDFSILREDKSALQNVMDGISKPEWMVRTVLGRLLIKGDDAHKPIGVLSGGERCKVCFAKLLLSGANLVMMDEPTNYLDLYSMEALGRLLTEWPGTLIFVSHDQAFVSRVATRLLIFDNGEIKTYEGTYKDFQASERQRGEALKGSDGSEGHNDQELLILKMKLSEVASKLGPQVKLADDVKKKYQAEMDALIEKIHQF
jgi:macrolide transport system ATP-binding/permease protein